MRNLMPFLGCTVGLAVVFAVIGFIGGVVEGLAFGDGGLVQSLKNGAFAAVMAGTGTFIAAALLAMRDGSRQASALQQVRQRLSARDDCSETEFTAPFPDVDPVLLLDIRRFIGLWYAVPAEKIRPHDDLQSDLGFRELEPQIQFGMIEFVLQQRNLHHPQLVSVTPGKITDFMTLAEKLQQIISHSVERPKLDIR